jgi:phosphoribosylanthranilate isomerase
MHATNHESVAAMNTRIKVCGITNLDDALLAVEWGADMLGFIFYAPSPRGVSREAAAEICRAVTVEKVGVFVNETEANIRQTAEACGLTALQFHGDEPPSFCHRFSLKTIKAIRIRDETSLRQAAEYDVDALLLDTYTASERGGTGKTFDWALAVKAQSLGKPIILSGGLTPDNVADAIRIVQPYAVDVASGVEREPGRKDPLKLRRFLEACRKNS